MARGAVRRSAWAGVVVLAVLLVGTSFFLSLLSQFDGGTSSAAAVDVAAVPGYLPAPLPYPAMADATDRPESFLMPSACDNTVRELDGAGAHAFEVVKGRGDGCLDARLVQLYDMTWLSEHLDDPAPPRLHLAFEADYSEDDGGVVATQTFYRVLALLEARVCQSCAALPLPGGGLVEVPGGDDPPVTWRASSVELPPGTQFLLLSWRIYGVASGSPETASLPAVFDDGDEVRIRVREPHVVFAPVGSDDFLVRTSDQSVQGNRLIQRATIEWRGDWSSVPEDAGVLVGVQRAPRQSVEAVDGIATTRFDDVVLSDTATGWFWVKQPDAQRRDPVVIVVRTETGLVAPVTERLVVGPLPVALMALPLAGWAAARRQMGVARRRSGDAIPHSLRRLGLLLHALLMTYVVSIAAFLSFSFRYGNEMDLATYPPSLPAAFLLLFWFLLAAAFATIALVLALLVRRSADRDLTHEQEVSRQLRSKTRELEDFAYAVSHDLKTPVMAMKWLLADLPEPRATMDRADFEATLGQVRDNLDGMEAFIADLLEIAKVGDMAATDVPTDLNAVAHDVVKQMGHLVAERGATLDVAADLGTWRGDKTLYRQLLTNLVGNALKYGCPEPGGTVRVRAERHDDEAWLVVEDDGPGIPDDERERVFEMFGRGSGASGKPGTGLGLSLVSKIAHAYGGSVRVEDAAGGGARFVVALPASRARTWRRVWAPAPAKGSPTPAGA